MNKKGQMGVGMIVLIAITIIIGAIFLEVIAQEVGGATSTIAITNESISTVVNDTAQYLDYRALSDVVVINATNGTAAFTTLGPVVGSGNYTITNNVINPTTGGLAVRILPDADAKHKSAWKISATAQPTTYIADSGSRAMANLIVVMFALAILAAVIGPAVSRQFIDSISG